MNLARFQADDGGGIPWVLALFLLPVLARLARALLETLGLVAKEPARGEPAPARARQREQEDEGRELFERLVRGEGPSEARRVPAPARPAPPPRRPREAEASLESEDEPLPLSVLGPGSEAHEPSEAPEFSLERAAASEVSLEDGAEPEPLAALGRRAELSEAEPLAVSSRAFRLLRGDLRRAVLLSELLSAPLSERELRPQPEPGRWQREASALPTTASGTPLAPGADASVA